MSSIKLLDNLNITNLNEKTWEELKQSNIPFIKKFKSKEEFASYSKRYLKKLAENFKRKINKMKYLNFQDK
jgi:predicted transcriptional regulator